MECFPNEGLSTVWHFSPRNVTKIGKWWLVMQQNIFDWKIVLENLFRKSLKSSFGILDKLRSLVAPTLAGIGRVRVGVGVRAGHVDIVWSSSRRHSCSALLCSAHTHTKLCRQKGGRNFLPPHFECKENGGGDEEKWRPRMKTGQKVLVCL